MRRKVYYKKAIIAFMSLTIAAGMTGIAAIPFISPDSSISAAAEQSAAGKYTVNIQLMQFHSEDLSMGNAAMIPQAVIVVNTDGTAHIEIDMQSLTYMGRDGYLGWLKKVTNIISENRFHYPIEFETEDAEILEEYIDVYDDFNTPGGKYADDEVLGKWYAKKLSIPIDFENREDDILVQVYVPVMESIMEGGGTKFAALDIDWDSLVKTEDFDIQNPTENPTEPTTESPTEAPTEPPTEEPTTIPNESAEYDKNKLEDGKYELYAKMIKTDRASDSMSNNGINHTVQLDVINGEYYLTVQFKGLAIYNQFGYLMNLYYYNAGYTYNQYGAPVGDVIPAEILSTYDTVDQYNDAEHLYPQLLKFPLVDKASGEEGYVPLQVFVPIMEAIADGTGTQSVLMQLDWSTLKKTESDIQLEEPDEQSPEFDFADTATGVSIHADKGVFPAGTTGKATEITSGADFTSAQNLIGGNFKLYDISLIGEDGTETKPNGKIQISIPVPTGYSTPVVYRISDGKKTLISGTVSDGKFTFSAKEAGLYAIADKDSKSAANGTPSNSKNSTNVQSPKTGDAGLGSALAGMMTAAGAVVLFRKRKEK